MRSLICRKLIVAGTLFGLTGCQSGISQKMAFWRWGRSTENDVKVADAGVTDSLAKPSSSATPQMANGSFTTVPPGASPPALAEMTNPAGTSAGINPYARTAMNTTNTYGQQASYTTPDAATSYPQTGSGYPTTEATPGQFQTANVTTRTEIYQPPTTSPYGAATAVQPQQGAYGAGNTGIPAPLGAMTPAPTGSYGDPAASSRRTAAAWNDQPSSPSSGGYQTVITTPASGYENYGGESSSAQTISPIEDSASGGYGSGGYTPTRRPWGDSAPDATASAAAPIVDTGAAYGATPAPYSQLTNTPDYTGGGTPGVTPNPPGSGRDDLPMNGGPAATQPAAESRTTAPFRPGSTSAYNPATAVSWASGSTPARWPSPPPSGMYPSTGAPDVVQAGYEQPTQGPAASVAAMPTYPGGSYPSTGSY